jgi:hypothetical protein
MSCFDITKTFYDELSSMIGRYWWSQQDRDKRHWLSWDKLLQTKEDGGLGFRDLYHFYLAMLAKQVWHLICNPDSLCGRILKARYFPHGNILQASCTHGASYTWCSITKGIDLMKEGMICRVGDGESIDIWNDPWLPRGTTWRVSSAQGHILLTRVSELINLITNMWDEELIQGIFHEDDAAVILGIPLAANRENSIAWQFDKKGLFSVKLAYKISVAASRDNHGPSSGETTQCPAMGTAFPWKKIWQLHLPNKVKQFAWRLAHNSLPMKRNI